MKIISYNLNGIRAATRKGFVEWLSEEAPDVIFRRAGFPTPALYYYKDFFIRNFIYNNKQKDNIS